MNDDRNARSHDLGARSHRLFVGADLRSAPADQRDTRLPDGKDHYRRRSSLRLPHHDYASPAAYFITVCTHQRRCLLGNIGDDAMQLNEAERVVDACWRDLPRHYAHVALDTFVIMPNHIHGIVTILPTTTSARAHGLTQIVRSFKAFSARQIGIRPLWQRGYYDHVIRGDESLAKIREYIAINPIRWSLDRENPANIGSVAQRARLRRAPTEE